VEPHFGRKVRPAGMPRPPDLPLPPSAQRGSPIGL